MRLCDRLAAYLERIRAERTYTKTTLKSYSHRLRVFAAWLGDAADATAFTEEAIEAYKLHLLDSVCGTTVGPTISAIRAFGNYLVEKGDLSENPALKVKKPKRTPPRRKYVSDTEATAMLAACERIADDVKAALAKAVVYTILYSGIRRSEVLAVQVDDLHLADGFFVVQHGKGDKMRFAIPHAEAVAAIEAWLTLRPADCLHPYLFAISRHQRLGDNGLRKLLREVAAIAGYKGATNLTPHPMRRNYATRMSREGVDIIALRDLLGHSLVATTEIYIQSSLEHLKAVAKKGALPVNAAPDVPVQPPARPDPLPPTAPPSPPQILRKAGWRRNWERDH